VSVAAPFFLWVAVAVALATVAAHLLAWRRPPTTVLPTARFAPERPARVVSRAVRPTDVALLALRVAMVMLAGVALAQPAFGRERRGSARVVVLDRSRSVSGTEAADSARAAFEAGDALVVFDSVAREVPAAASDSITAGARLPVGQARGSISAALVTAVRAAERLARDRDSVEVVVVSPVTKDELDAATSAIRGRWAGALRVIRTTAAPGDSTSAARPDVSAGANDPVAASFTLVGPITGGARVRIRRASISAADSAWSRDGGTLVAWPANVDGTGWARPSSPDTAYAVVAELDGSAGEATAAVVASFERRLVPPAGRVVARWGDGDPAATEATLGAGCIRAVAVDVPASGDLPLTPAFLRFARQMAAPCGPAVSLEPASDSLVARLLPAQPVPPADSVASVDPASREPSRTMVWLLAGALALAVAELFLRRGVTNATG
jgi:hypothetical protein